MRGLQKKLAYIGKASTLALLNHKKISAVLAILIIVGAMGFKFTQALSAPSYGHTITAPVSQQKTEAVGQTYKSSGFLDNQYFTLNYPQRYQEMAKPDTKSPGVEDYWLLAAPMDAKSGTSQAGITLKANANLDNESSLRAYQLNNKYRIVSRAFGPTKATFVSSTEDPKTEETAYIAHGNYLLIVKVTVRVGSNSLLDSDMSKMLMSLQWK